MNKTLSMVNIVPIKKTIESLMVTESDSLAVSAVCKEFLGKLNEGVSETVLCESFVLELSKVANTTTSKDAVKRLTESMKANDTNIKLANSVEALKHGPCMFVAPMIESAVVDYIVNKNSETRDNLRVAVSLFENENNVVNILETLNYETYQERSGVALNNAVLESVEEVKEKLYTQAEVNAIIESKSNDVVVESVKKTYRDIHTNLGLSGTISKILAENKNNEKLKVFCGQYISAMNEGRSEESLCESFISGVSNWNYLSAVDTEISALSDRVSKYKQEISFKKIMETMLQTSSYYIVPLIEDCIVEYVENKNMQTRGTMLQRLYSFEYDPFVRDIITIVTRDLSIDNTVKIEESLSEQFTEIEYVYSPIQYIKENECVFNVKGSYFVRKGNSVSKLTRKAVAELSESFKSLCNIVNSGSVSFSNIDDTVTVYDGYNMAVISESEIIINGKKTVTNDLDNLYETAVAMNSSDKNFYGLVKIMNENYNDIAYIDFVKRVSSKDGSGKAVDVFKIKNNIFVNTVNENLKTSTFYRNVNPIQCRNYINEHMEINVAPLFEDVLPEQEKIEKEISDKKKEYEEYIESLEDKKEVLRNMKGEADSDDIEDAIAMIDKEIEDTKSDYEKYQKDSDKYLNGDDDDKDDSLADEVPVDDEQPEDEPETDNDDAGDREPNETPAEMEVPIEKTQPTIDPDDFATDPDFDGVADFDSDFDAPAVNKDNDTSFDVVKVSYNRNIKTGEYTGKGEVLVVIPSVDANGDVHNETRKVSFYLDPSSDEKKAVINNDYMPLDMYLAIQNAIEECPETDTIVLSKPVAGIEEPVTELPNVDVSTEVPVEKDTEIDAVLPEEPKVSDEPVEIPTEVTSTETVSVETPAETQEKTSTTKYPISLGIYPDEIAPMDMDDFEKSLDDMKIKHSASEAADGEVVLEIANRAQAHALRKHFNKWMNYNDDQFNEFFPEMKECFRSVNEGVSIMGIEAISETREEFSVGLPATQEICEMFNIDRNDDGLTHIQLIAESNAEAYKIYEKLYVYARKNNFEVETDVLDILEKYETKYFDRVYESLVYTLNVPYNGFLSQKMSSKGYHVNESKGVMSIEIYKEDSAKAKKILESFYSSNEIPGSVNDFFQFASNLNEAVTITIRDDKSGKTVEINTDDALNGDNGANQEANFSSSFDNVTFNPEDSLAFADDEDSADDEKKEDDKKEDNDKLNDSEKQEPNESETEDTEDAEGAETEGEEEDNEESEESSDDTSEEKPKKKFKFRSKKKDESVNTGYTNALNENASATVMDCVKLKHNGKKGQIIGQLSDNDVIVHVEGHTLVLPTKEVELLSHKYDTLPPHMKFDPLTLKGVYESYIGCGLFINNMRITPEDCQVKIMEFFSTPDDKEVELVIEGERTKAIKKYIRLTENVNDVFDIANYAKGKMIVANESVDVLIHMNDYNEYRNVNESYKTVRTLVFNDKGETSMTIVSGSVLRLDSKEDVYIPEYVESISKSIDTLLS